MPAIEFGHISTDMRLMESGYGIAALQNLNAFAASFVPVSYEIVSASPFYAVVRQYDAHGAFVTISLSGALYAGQVTSFAAEALGVRETVYGDFTVTPEGAFYGTATRLEARLVQYDSLLAHFTGLNAAVSNDLPEVPPDEVLLAGADTIASGSGNDYLLGYDGNDSLLADLGSDTLDGGSGADTMAGGPGDDVYHADSDGDRIIEAVGGGADLLLAWVSITLPAGVEDLTLIGSLPVDGTGNGLANRLTGNDAANSLFGEGGNDTLDGGQGNDRLEGGGGADQLSGGAGDDTLVGGPPGWEVATIAAGNHASLSADGRFVAFDTYEALTEGDIGLDYDVFVANLADGTIQRVSLLPGGGEPNYGGGGSDPAISGTGRFVAFVGAWTELLGGAYNTWPQVIVKDLEQDTAKVASSSAAGEADYALSSDPAISADGRYVAFVSYSALLTPGDTNGVADVFVKDLQTGAIELVSRDAAPANGRSAYPSISADGRYVGFLSEATNLVVSPPLNYAGYYVKDRATGSMVLACEPSGVNGDPWAPALSGDGRHVAWPDQLTGEVFVKDLDSGIVASAWIDTTGAPGGGVAVSLSHDARYVSFSTRSQMLPELEPDGWLPSDPYGRYDVLVRDMQSGAITVVTEPGERTGVMLDAEVSELSADGSAVAMLVGYPDGLRVASAFEAYAGSDVLAGGAGNDWYWLEAYEEIVEAPGAGMDTVVTTLPDYELGPDVERVGYFGDPDFTATGNALDNAFAGGGGNDSIDGREGWDTVLYWQPRANFALVADPQSLTVMDLTGIAGTDVLAGVERLAFSDRGVIYSIGGAIADLLGLWQAGFDRLPDAVEIGRWLAPFDAGRPAVEVAADIIATYAPGVSNATVVTVLCLNIFERPPEPGELAAYVGVLDRGEMTQAELYLAGARLDATTAQYIDLVGVPLEYDVWS
jgi:Ca2+-binding RTX toxin-like protein